LTSKTTSRGNTKPRRW